MNNNAEERQLHRSLKNTGCDEAAIQKFFQLQKEGKREEQFRLLSMHKASLLGSVHLSQPMIDCLDFLVYTMKKEQVQSN